MKHIISASRRTDIPAFYGRWFMGRLQEGFAGVVNPFGGQRFVVSLKPEDVAAFVFWSKDFTPFVDNLKTSCKWAIAFTSITPSPACRRFSRAMSTSKSGRDAQAFEPDVFARSYQLAIRPHHHIERFRTRFLHRGLPQTGCENSRAAWRGATSALSLNTGK
jgi:hypothetical protein